MKALLALCVLAAALQAAHATPIAGCLLTGSGGIGATDPLKALPLAFTVHCSAWGAATCARVPGSIDGDPIAGIMACDCGAEHGPHVGELAINYGISFPVYNGGVLATQLITCVPTGVKRL
eukprot:m.266714 g.266714  ORF g.266714 m.266714 type:complete len:121 (-) comp31998_c0_seq1:23-385(-)